MAREISLPPKAASLTESMRDLGYSMETAVADLIDNSIAAEATKVQVFLDSTENIPVLAIVDDGCGMSEAGLIEAMRHGSKNPKEERAPNDLGRFGLGLKTASLSQCRNLSLISRRDGVLAGAEWDLDLIEERDEWVVSVLSEAEIRALPYIDELPCDCGTLILWRKLDRVSEGLAGPQLQDLINHKLSALRQHLSLVFHKFLAGEAPGHQSKLKIAVNGDSVSPFDPFCKGNPSLQKLPLERVNVNGYDVSFQPYVLPHHSKLLKSEYDFYKTKHDFLSNQGAYVYRHGRLMAWGDWFRLIPKGEATKLARVEIDFPNALDTEWTIDIKKSRAYPPQVVRRRLREILDQVTNRAIRVHRGRGEKQVDLDTNPVWIRQSGYGGITYIVNSDHPLVALVEGELSEIGIRNFKLLLKAISASLPVEMIYSDCAASPREVGGSGLAGDTLREDVINLVHGLSGIGIRGASEVYMIVRSMVDSVVTDDELDKLLQEIGDE